MGQDIEILSRDVEERVIGWQRAIHADPEIGFETHRTADERTAVGSVASRFDDQRSAGDRWSAEV